MTKETYSFQAEVGKILDIVAHSLYSQKEVFLRELISNASDACDKLRYHSLTEPELLSGNGDFAITLAVDPKAKTLTISDNGIGMSKDDMSSLLIPIPLSDMVKVFALGSTANVMAKSPLPLRSSGSVSE